MDDITYMHNLISELIDFYECPDKSDTWYKESIIKDARDKGFGYDNEKIKIRSNYYM
jgi:hypothetical protein